jgi:hypothetical protein
MFQPLFTAEEEEAFRRKEAKRQKHRHCEH